MGNKSGIYFHNAISVRQPCVVNYIVVFSTKVVLVSLHAGLGVFKGPTRQW